jgi:hypothetical protein
MNDSEQEESDAELEERLNALLRKAEALKVGGKTEGEREAAAVAANRIRAKLLELKDRQRQSRKVALRSASVPAAPPPPSPSAAPSPWWSVSYTTSENHSSSPPQAKAAARQPRSKARRKRPLPSELSETTNKGGSFTRGVVNVVIGVLVLLSYAAIARLAIALYNAWIMQNRLPDIVRVSEAIVGAVFIIRLLIVNWPRYWRSTPQRLQHAWFALNLNGQTLFAFVFLAGAIAFGWTSWIHSHDYELLSMFGLVISGMVFVIAAFHLVMALGISIYIIIFGWGNSTSNMNIDAVRNQNADIDADFADDDEIAQALGGNPSNGQPRPYKYND